jgi:hypothetical protein
VRADLPEPERPRGLLSRFRRKEKTRRGRGTARPDKETIRSIERFLATREGVEAYVEPQTPTAPLSVVLVAADGEWVRKRIPDAAWLQKVSKAARMPVYEVALVGYPKRMREYRRPGMEDERPS